MTNSSNTFISNITQSMEKLNHIVMESNKAPAAAAASEQSLEASSPWH